MTTIDIVSKLPGTGSEDVRFFVNHWAEARKNLETNTPDSYQEALKEYVRAYNLGRVFLTMDAFNRGNSETINLSRKLGALYREYPSCNKVIIWSRDKGECIPITNREETEKAALEEFDAFLEKLYRLM